MSKVEERYHVRYWGVRGSIPTPGPHTVRYGGNTTCIEFECDDQRIIVDSGAGIRELGNKLMAGEGPIKLTLIYSHLHVDHIMGLPFFAPMYSPRTELDIYVPATNNISPDAFFRWHLSEPWLPVDLDFFSAKIRFHELAPGDLLQIGDAQVRTCSIAHPGGAMAIRVDHRGHAFVQCSDIEHGDVPSGELVTLCSQADYLSYDATYATTDEYQRHKGWGHSTWQAGIKVADAAHVDRFIAFHHDPSHDDTFMDKVADALGSARPGSLVAMEGMVLDLLSGDVQFPE